MTVGNNTNPDDFLESFHSLNDRLEAQFGVNCFYPEIFLPFPKSNYWKYFGMAFEQVNETNQGFADYKHAIAVVVGRLCKFRNKLDAVHLTKASQSMGRVKNISEMSDVELKHSLGSWSNPSPEWFEKDKKLLDEYTKELLDFCNLFKFPKDEMYRYNAICFLGATDKYEKRFI